jgi:FkbM family methyltransferase
MLAPATKADDQLFSLLGLDRVISVVDIGSNPTDGTIAPPYAGILANELCSVIGFEPHEPSLKKLREDAGKLETYFPYVVGTGKPGVMHVYECIGLSSMLELDPVRLPLLNLHQELLGQLRQEIPTTTVRLDDIVEIEHIDYLKIDIQGGEWDVFEHGRNKLADAVAIHTEVSLFPLYKRQPLFSDIDVLLREMGFVFHCFDDVKRWPIAPAVIDEDPKTPLRQTVEADVVYVRDWTKPMAAEQWKMLAAIAHHVYRSYDLALRAIVMLAKVGKLPATAPEDYANLLRGMAR